MVVSLPLPQISDHSSPTSHPKSGFLIRLGAAMQASGSPADRVEETLLDVARQLGVRGQFFSNPTSILFSMEIDSQSFTHLERVDPGNVDLGRLAALEEAVREMSHPDWSVGFGLKRLEQVTQSRTTYPAFLEILACGVVSGAAARFFGGGLGDILTSALLGGLAGLLTRLSAEQPRIRRVMDFLLAMLISASATLGAAYLLGLSSYVITVSSLIVFIPGLTLTVALTELATQHWVSGTARLAGAGVILISMGFGVAVGRGLILEMPGGLPEEINPVHALPLWSEALALFLAPLCFVILFRARPRDSGMITLCGIAGYLTAKLVGQWLNPNLGAFGGALVVGLISNLHRQLRSVPAMVTMLPGIVLLVPGSLGFLSLYTFIDQDVLHGVEVGFRMMLIGISIVAGLLFANLAFRPPVSSTCRTE